MRSPWTSLPEDTDCRHHIVPSCNCDGTGVVVTDSTPSARV